jgi:hypothetical protein
VDHAEFEEMAKVGRINATETWIPAHEKTTPKFRVVFRTKHGISRGCSTPQQSALADKYISPFQPSSQ